MRALPKRTYPTAAELDQLVEAREMEAALMAPGAARQSVLRDIVQLRAYANMKRLLTAGKQ